MITITKRFGEFPMAHRQWRHKGHCALIHGHNWTFDITFSTDEAGGDHLDENGFIVDFGDMGGLKDSLSSLFDHTMWICEDDPEAETFRNLKESGLVKLFESEESVSAECFAKKVLIVATDWLLAKFGEDTPLYVSAVVCWEDGKNSARFEL